MDKKKRFTLDKMTFLLFTIIPLVLYTFFYIISVVSGMYYSLTDWNGLNPTYNFVGISNYIALSKNNIYVALIRENPVICADACGMYHHFVTYYCSCFEFCKTV